LPRHEALTMRARFEYLGRKTFYTEHGDIFAWACVVVAAGIACYAVVKEREIKRKRLEGKSQR